MEKANVFLVPSHHAFKDGHVTWEQLHMTEGSIKLEESMLSGFMCWGRDAVGTLDRKDYEACLGALLHLPPFTTFMSLRYEQDPFPHLQFTKRDWAMIFHNGRLVASFTHSREGHRPFERLYEWIGHCGASRDEWHRFFLQRIKEEVEAWKAVAERATEEAQETVTHANRVLVELIATT